MTKKTSSKNQLELIQSDGLFTLKIALYLILGSLWFKVMNGSTNMLPIPAGLLVGILLVRHEHFQIDRKIEYAVLIIAALIGFLAPYGLYVSF